MFSYSFLSFFFLITFFSFLSCLCHIFCSPFSCSWFSFSILFYSLFSIFYHPLLAFFVGLGETLSSQKRPTRNFVIFIISSIFVCSFLVWTTLSPRRKDSPTLLMILMLGPKGGSCLCLPYLHVVSILSFTWCFVSILCF